MPEEKQEAKWFIGAKAAEGEAYFPVKLTKQEYAAVRKFISAQKEAIGGSYCGGFDFLEDGICFETKEEAIRYINDEYIF